MTTITQSVSSGPVLPSTTTQTYPRSYHDHTSLETSGALQINSGILGSKSDASDKALRGFIKEALANPTLLAEGDWFYEEPDSSLRYTADFVKVAIIQKALDNGYLPEINKILCEIGRVVHIPLRAAKELNINYAVHARSSSPATVHYCSIYQEPVAEPLDIDSKEHKCKDPTRLPSGQAPK